MNISTLPSRPPSVQIDADTAGLIVVHTRVMRTDQPDIESAVYVRADQVVSIEMRYSESSKPLGATLELAGGKRVYARESVEAVVSLLARMREASREHS